MVRASISLDGYVSVVLLNSFFKTTDSLALVTEKFWGYEGVKLRYNG